MSTSSDTCGDSSKKAVGPKSPLGPATSSGGPVASGVTAAGVSALHRARMAMPAKVQSQDWVDVEPSTSEGPSVLTAPKKSKWAPKRKGSHRKAINRSSPAFRGETRLPSEPSSISAEHSKYWSESVTPGDHIWIDTGSSGDCYVKETLCVKSGEKRKCAACHAVAHTCCLPELSKMNFTCKPTYRETVTKFQKDQIGPVHHHWVHKKRQDGRCKRCQRAFQAKFLSKETIAIGCSWCKDAYHNKSGCFTWSLIEETCPMGPLGNIIIPPSWLLRLPQKVSTIRKRISTGTGSTKKKKRSRKDRLFIAKHPGNLTSPAPRFPLLVFVNPKSGGNKGAKVLHTMWWLLNPRQVFDITALKGPKYGLEVFRKIANLRVLVCGGDGTVGWLLSTLDSLKWTRWPPIAILPLGTGNDLANTLGWGRNYADDPLSNFLGSLMKETAPTKLDRWRAELSENKQAADDDPEAADASKCLPLAVFNNYFSIGADAQVALEFHQSRAANPDMFNSRFRNRLFYGGYGTKDLFKRSCRDLSEHLTLECDGVNLTPKIQDLKLHCLLFLNIPRYAGGTNPWGASSSSPNSPSCLFQMPSICDGKLEVLGFTTASLAALQMGGHGERLAQCSTIRLITRKTFPVQVDGEPCRLAPSKITFRFHNQASMLQRIHHKASRTGRQLPPFLPSSSDSPSLTAGSSLCNSVLLTRLPVGRVSQTAYEQWCYELDKLIASAVPLCEITVESEADLDQAREQITRSLTDRRVRLQHSLTAPVSPSGSRPPITGNSTSTPLSADWCFIDYITNERAYRIPSVAESLHSVSDICNTDDRLLVLDSKLGASTDDRPDSPGIDSSSDVFLADADSPSDGATKTPDRKISAPAASPVHPRASRIPNVTQMRESPSTEGQVEIVVTESSSKDVDMAGYVSPGEVSS